MINSAEEFVKLRCSECQQDYLKAAHDSASLEVWMEVVSKFPHMKVWVAHNKTVPIEVLRYLASDADWRVRHAVATKNKLSNDLMVLLAGDADESVRLRIAYNKRTDLTTLEKLANDESQLVSSVAQHRLNRQYGDTILE